jgi:ubiquinone/menaquinone biosynthesis C-methylase UbiE
MSSSTTTTPLEQLKAVQQRIWSSGDYNRIAALTVPVAEQLVDTAGPRPGDAVLDVATGTGHAALAAARRGAVSTGVDYVPELVAIARRRASAEVLDVTFVEGDAENLPFPDDSFDQVLSAIGVMFVADHARAAAELARVTRPGGRIALASWTPTGFVGHMLKTVGAHVPPPAAAQPATRWGSEDVVHELLGDRVTDVASSTESVTQRFASAVDFADLFLTYYGPTHTAASTLSGPGRQALRDDLVALANTFDRSDDGTVVCDWEYLVVTATVR